MIEIKQYKKIYITSIYEKTGGPKTLHQLAEFLVNQGVDVYICLLYTSPSPRD